MQKKQPTNSKRAIVEKKMQTVLRILDEVAREELLFLNKHPQKKAVRESLLSNLDALQKAVKLNAAAFTTVYDEVKHTESERNISSNPFDFENIAYKKNREIKK